MREVTPITWIVPPEVDGEPGRIKSTSLSREQYFSNCPRQAYLKFAMKVPAPERIIPEGEEAPNLRGDRLHKLIEKFIKGEHGTLDADIEHRREIIGELASGFMLGQAKVEERWNFDDVWGILDDKDWENMWFILKADAVLFGEDDEVDVYDWKSGKKQYNEIKHGWQLMVYMVATFMRYPNLERIRGHLEYIDANEHTIVEMTRAQAMSHFPRVNGKLLAVTNAREFPPTPSRSHCRFCDYKTGDIDATTEGTGHCNLNPE